MKTIMDEQTTQSSHFQKKVYTRLSKSDLSSINPKDAISHRQDSSLTKKIIATSIGNNLREEFKKSFVPLLIEVFELRQSISNHKSQEDNPLLICQNGASLEEITKRLENLQKEIEETKRWCEGVSLQIAKGLNETKGLPTPNKKDPRKFSFQKFFNKLFLKNLLKVFEKTS